MSGMTPRTARRSSKHLGALALAFGVVTGGFALTAAPAFADTVETPAATESAAAPSVATDKSDYAPTDVVVYVGTDWLPNDTVQVTVEGPYGGTFEAETDENGAVTGEIKIVETDHLGNETGNDLPWPNGSYSITISQEQPDETPAPTETTDPTTDPTDTVDPTTDATDTVDPTTDPTDTPTPTDPSSTARELVSASASFTVGGGAVGTTGPEASQSPRQLAETGADDVFGIAGLGLLVAGAGAAALIGRRIIARRA